MAISSWGKEKSKTLRVVGGCSCWSSWSPQAMLPPGKWILGCRMTRWRRSTVEGSIYRTKWAGANLTYLFVASVKSEGVQVDMVTVRTTIKGLCTWFGKLRNSRNLQEKLGWGCLDLVINCQSREVIAEKCHYWGEFRSINDFIPRNWKACVDTIFGHVSLYTHLELMKRRSADWAMVASLQGSCRWRNGADGETTKYD